MALSQALVTWYAALALSRISAQDKPFHFGGGWISSCAAGGDFWSHKHNKFTVSGNFWRFRDYSALILHYGESGNEPVTYHLFVDRDIPIKQLDPNELKASK